MIGNRMSSFVHSRPRWALPALVLLMAMVVVLWQRPPRAAPADSPAPAKAPAGVFRPTKEQWAGMQIAEVKMLAFHTTLTTDGNIAFNDDAVTPVFSPYSGRVDRLIAKLGDVVKKGAPLMAIEASEFVQGRSDVASARANLDAARAVEQRQHDLYEAGAGALKDWRQSQADRVVAEGAL
ncbi:MAG: efflux RND transporter periplasmic adaptor subunit, partial [Rhodocyclaceae bacterium]|nr:efflux RND transporter periplasmic adaptor subunit [Rhodocyclaceae bacterium]